MGGIFRSTVDGASDKIMTAAKKAVINPDPTPSPATGGDAMGSTGGMADTRSPVTRASTMLSPRRRREDEMRPTVGTKTLLGQ